MQIKLEKFEGPFELLLKLIEEEELEITDISLSEVAEQYISYLNQIEVKNPEHLADFLVVATKLLYMKSRFLLPQLNMDDEDGADLEEQLKLYKKYYDASKILEEILAQKRYTYSRPEVVETGRARYVPSKGLDGNKLKNIFRQILVAMESPADIPNKTMKQVISIRRRIEEIRNLLKTRDSLGFNDVLAGTKSRVDVIVSFLGMLELVKQRAVIVRQEAMFDEIIIEKI